jgi:hypothetical protein
VKEGNSHVAYPAATTHAFFAISNRGVHRIHTLQHLKMQWHQKAKVLKAEPSHSYDFDSKFEVKLFFVVAIIDFGEIIGSRTMFYTIRD